MNDCFLPLDYESRNLGMPAYHLSDEFMAAPNEAILSGSLVALRSSLPRFFMQARVDKSRAAAIPLLGRNGFLFAECAITPFTNLRTNPVLRAFLADRNSVLPGRYAPAEVSVTELDRTDRELTARVREIAAESFVDDRFHLDPHCPPPLADRRYRFWVDDLLAADGTFHLMRIRSAVVGFMARRREHLVLAGFTRTYAAAGLGDYLWLSVLATMLTDDIGTAVTQIAVNNIAVLNLYARLGFKFKSPATVFHLWHGTPPSR